jgi:hypothetical protein
MPLAGIRMYAGASISHRCTLRGSTMAASTQHTTSLEAPSRHPPLLASLSLTLSQTWRQDCLTPNTAPPPEPRCWTITTGLAVSDDWGYSWRHARPPPSSFSRLGAFRIRSNRQASGLWLGRRERVCTKSALLHRNAHNRYPISACEATEHA